MRIHLMTGRMPNFFLAGVPKSGSTSLYRYLDQHPQIFMCPVKEPHFFADEVRVENFEPRFQRRAAASAAALRDSLASRMTGYRFGGPVSTWEDYCRLFSDAAGEKAVGEASVCYLWSRTAARNIMARIPEARFLVVLRNPVDRAYSQYVQMLSYAEEPVSFREHVERSLRSPRTRFSELYPFLELGLYGEQLERLFQVVPRSSVRIFFYEDYCRDPGSMLRDIFEFLEVDRDFVPDFSHRHMIARVPRSYPATRWLKRARLWQLAKRLFPITLRVLLREAIYRPTGEFVPDSADRAFVAEYYRRDLDKLSNVLGFDFSGWLQPPSRTPSPHAVRPFVK